jgi:hypothetical protein
LSRLACCCRADNDVFSDFESPDVSAEGECTGRRCCRVVAWSDGFVTSLVDDFEVGLSMEKILVESLNEVMASCTKAAVRGQLSITRLTTCGTVDPYTHLSDPHRPRRSYPYNP